MRLSVLGALVLCGCHAILPLSGPTEYDGGGPPDADLGDLGDASLDGRAGDAAGDVAGDGSGDVGPAPDINRYWKNQIDAGPGALHNTVAVYHAKRQSVVLFGGTTCSGGTSSVLWEYKNGAWKAPCFPCGPKRAGHALVYDAKRAQLVLYGGVAKAADGQSAQGELYEWGDLSQTAALVLPGSPSPEPLTDAFATYDQVRERMVLFGGHTKMTTAEKTLRNDVWEYDGTQWHGPLPSTGLRPEKRFSYPQSMTFVPAPAHAKLANRSVFCGGRDENYLYDDCWAWDGAAWEKLCDNCTQKKRHSAPLVFDPVARQLYLMGGYGNGIELAGTWTSGDGQSWSALDPAMPKARDTMAAAYHAADDAVVVYGGNGKSPCGCNGTYPWSKNCDEMLLYVQP